MTPEQKGQHIILTVMIVLALLLSWGAVPSENTHKTVTDNSQSGWILRPWVKNLKIFGSEPAAPAVSEPDETDAVPEPAEPEAPAAVVTAPEPDAAPPDIAEPESTPEPESESVTAETTGPAPQAEPVEAGIILMNNPGYDSHTKPIVRFTHQTHIDDYTRSCGDCHHDDTGAPLDDLTLDDPVDSCIDCHPGTERKTGGKLSREEKIMAFHHEALHANCIGCHKAFNIENGDPKGKKPAPVSCRDCHK